MSDDERAIRELIETWMAASFSRDIPKVLGLMADDVVFMVPGQEPFGKEAFGTKARGLDDAKVEGKSEILEVVVAGEWAWCRTQLEVTSTPPNGKRNRRSGYTLSIFKKKPQGQWVLARDANLLAP